MEKKIARVEEFTTTRTGNLKSVYTMFDTIDEAVTYKLTVSPSFVQVLAASGKHYIPYDMSKHNA